MVVKQEVVVGVIKNKMERTVLFAFYLLIIYSTATAQSADSTKVYKKRVLESTEVDLLMSLYNQDGTHSPVNGGIGTEKLKDATPTIVISIPLNDDDVLTIDAGISAYTSASSSNINPFKSVPSTLKSGSLISATGASRSGGGSTVISTPITYKIIGTPWLASTGASQSDVLKAVHTNYSHSSDTRNFIWGSNLSLSKEYDYTSFGLGGNVTGLFNEKNTEVGLKGSVYVDTWKPIYPTELREYEDYGVNFQSSGYFKGVPVLNQAGGVTTAYLPSGFKAWDQNGRNSYTMSFLVPKFCQSGFRQLFSLTWSCRRGCFQPLTIASILLINPIIISVQQLIYPIIQRLPTFMSINWLTILSGCPKSAINYHWGSG
jgi:hypothetical protein